MFRMIKDGRLFEERAITVGSCMCIKSWYTRVQVDTLR